MKHVPFKAVLFLLLTILLIPQMSEAVSKTFVKEYTYQASEDDSRNSSRVIALREVKRLLLEELGTYLESQTEVRNFQLTKDQITTLTAGIVQTEIVAEKWDGKEYWLKSKITADPDKVAQSINALRKDRDKAKELEAMRQKSDELFRENEKLRKELAASKDAGREAQKAAYDQSVRKLSSAEWLEKGYAAADHKAALAAYSRAIELDPNNVRALYARARQSDQAAALKDYSRLLEVPPKTKEDYLIRAWTYKELEKRDLALREFGKAIEAAPDSKAKAEAWYDRGRYNEIFDKELALLDFSKAIELDPGKGEYYRMRGSSYWGFDKNDLALRDLNRAIELDPKSAINFGTRGLVLMSSKPEQALADLGRAIELEPSVADYMYRARVYERLGKTGLAIQDYSRILELFPEHKHFYNTRGALYAKLGRHDLALKDYTKTIQLDPDRVSGYMDRGKYFAQYGKHDQAVKDFTRAIKLKPEFDAYVERGLSWFKLGKDDLALKDYNTAIGLNYQYPGEAYYNRALLYARQKNAAKALQDVTKVMQLDPYYKRKAKGDPQFDFIRNHPEFVKTLGS